MSEKTEGVLFQVESDAALAFFADLPPATFLRLTKLGDDQTWGIYTEGWPGDREVLQEIARSASTLFGKSLFYGYYSAVGFCIDLFEQGERVKFVDPDHDRQTTWGTGSLFQPFGREDSMHEVLEAAFSWAHSDWELEVQFKPQ